MPEPLCILCHKPLRLVAERVSLPANDAFLAPVFDLYKCPNDETRSWVRRWQESKMEPVKVAV